MKSDPKILGRNIRTTKVVGDPVSRISRLELYNERNGSLCDRNCSADHIYRINSACIDIHILIPAYRSTIIGLISEPWRPSTKLQPRRKVLALVLFISTSDLRTTHFRVC